MVAEPMESREVNDHLRDSLELQMELAIADGADIADLQALLTERLGIEFDDDGNPVLVAQEDISETDEEGIPQVKHFRTITDRAGGDPQKALEIVEWMLTLRKSALDKAAQVKEHAAHQRAQIDDWEMRETKRVTGRLGWIDWLLQWHLRETCPNPKDEISVVAGRVRWAKQRSHIEWDETAALEACLQRDDVDEVAPRKLAKAALKAKLTKRDGRYYDADTGECVAFVVDVEPDVDYLPEIKQ